MEPNLAESIYVRSSIKFFISPCSAKYMAAKGNSCFWLATFYILMLWITLDMTLIFGFNIPGKYPYNKKYLSLLMLLSLSCHRQQMIRQIVVEFVTNEWMNEWLRSDLRLWVRTSHLNKDLLVTSECFTVVVFSDCCIHNICRICSFSFCLGESKIKGNHG